MFPLKDRAQSSRGKVEVGPLCVQGVPATPSGLALKVRMQILQNDSLLRNLKLPAGHTEGHTAGHTVGSCPLWELFRAFTAQQLQREA